jgi:protein-tyrosine-phosphatase
MTAPPFHALFLCTGNSARSILAECLLNREGKGRFVAQSAGSHPTGRVHPLALALLEQRGFDTHELHSKSWDVFAGPDAPAFDFVITVCDSAAGEACPVWIGQPTTAHWGMPDPAAREGAAAEQARAFADAYRVLSNRIRRLVQLPLASLDQRMLKQRLDEIGHSHA